MFHRKTSQIIFLFTSVTFSHEQLLLLNLYESLLKKCLQEAGIFTGLKKRYHYPEKILKKNCLKSILFLHFLVKLKIM